MIGVAVVAFGGVVSRPGMVRAQVGAAGFGVGATVLRSCDIETTALAFGVYDPVVLHAAQPLDRDASVAITCTKGTPATIGINDGSNGTSGARYLASGTARLRYDLFRDGARTQRWGDGPADALLAGEAPSEAPRAFIVYGRVFSNQDVPVGTYSDSVVVTVEF